ncbi:hypothetical protein NQ317_002233 [Molorchus minor]|uniref:Reverse transcriptase domain-containing protein n=1 Tax=Molorchus minor TaxID=1323400 RepID=A0ABQ9JE59_9CUCU|nr:hypothetical protein NQ317_002233 [Molorchus minor]
MLDRVKKVRKGLSKDLDFLDGKKNKSISRKALEKRRLKDNKFGFGGKKRGMKINTKDSAADIKELRPINTLPPIGKILELEVYNQLLEHVFQYNSILISHQSGFCKNHSCEAALQLMLGKFKN